ncbi:hypothetical protein ACFL67_00085 [candidate division KSB1 bacterium]
MTDLLRNLHNKKSQRYKTTSILFLFIFLLSVIPLYSQQDNAVKPAEFSQIIDRISESGGFFYTDNWVSNELTYLDVIETLERYNVKGGVYIGVGPEQNYSYIHAIQPEKAFIVDIRHQNRMQHLVYKILMEKTDTRAEWCSKIFSMPLENADLPGNDANAQQIMRFLYGKRTVPEMMEKTVNTIYSELTNRYEFSLSRRDSLAITYIMRNFRFYNLNITYRGASVDWYPTFREIMLMKDMTGQYSNPFDSFEDFSYIREMHQQNRILPVTGDFGGTKALKELAAYLKENNLTVSAFYLSNVEQYVFRDPRKWRRWVENVRALPIDENSVFIRWTHDYGWQGQTRLQKIKTFLENYDSGKYYNYDDLKRIDYLK